MSVSFSHGVASGDPLPTAVVIWTRVTPSADATPGSGKGAPTKVRWQVATDAAFTSVVASGSLVTSPDTDHSVKLDVTGLAPGTQYRYRFSVGSVMSPVGITRTAPATDADLQSLRLGIVSCSNWQAGWFSAYRHLLARKPWAVVHLGDYLYEYGDGQYGLGHDNTVVRPQQPGHEIVTLADYRQRHAQYKTDPDLQRLHASVPFICTWDDHEVANDSWKGGAQNHDPATEGSWTTRKTAAHRAYDEWMPVRLSGTATVGDGERIYRRFSFGTLADLSMLDLRSYRSAPGSWNSDPAATGRTITGTAQLGWLEAGLLQSNAQWKLIGNPVMIAPVNLGSLPAAARNAIAKFIKHPVADGVALNKDQWDGYPADRHALLSFLSDHAITDTVFLTGDIHSGWASDLPLDPGNYPHSPSVATELVGPSVTSNNFKDEVGVPAHTLSVPVADALRGFNPYIKYIDLDSNGFCVLDVTPARVRMDWYAISHRSDPKATARWTVSYEVEASSQRVRRVTTAPRS